MLMLYWEQYKVIITDLLILDWMTLPVVVPAMDNWGANQETAVDLIDTEIKWSLVPNRTFDQLVSPQ